ncbi:hypothetical protein V6N11_067697 [Hibiscus sabdariffa]|uniref:Uncharacterized protein n=1 Tax=Hibiscus sabdariffa TaxID=183260 RepID=A0ABR2SS61_9ROSI
MANTVLDKTLTTTTTTSFIFFFFFFFIQTKQDNPCPYPCNPPPTGTGGGSIGGGVAGTVTQTPPASYSPPSQTGVYPPPTGNLPYYTQPPPYGGNSFYGQPPPPDPIMPYFPFYYRKPPHRTVDQSSGTTVRPGKSIFVITALPLLPQIFLYLLF